MFGTNPVRKQDLDHADALRVQKVFPTIQGEGPFAGVPAIFVRLAGCNLRCYFCDTEFESNHHETRTVAEVVSLCAWLSVEHTRRRTKLVVLTGGEPFRQNIVELCASLGVAGFMVQIETAGTLWVPGMEELMKHGNVLLVCSPKTPKVHPAIETWCTHWKYLIDVDDFTSAEDVLPSTNTQLKDGPPQPLARPPRPLTDTIWLQPAEAYVNTYKLRPHKLMAEESDQQLTNSVRDEAKTKRNMQYAAELALRYNYHISLQLHKYLGLE